MFDNKGPVNTRLDKPRVVAKGNNFNSPCRRNNYYLQVEKVKV